jgi:phenylalanyl-tRNA synthetase beta chain
MRVPLSWLRDYVDIDLTPEQLAYTLTMGGLEVEEIEHVGLPLPERKPGEPQAFKTTGLGWDRDKLVVAAVLEVGAHPNADRLTLLRVDDGSGVEQQVLTGAPNLFHLKGCGPLATPLKVAYAREGAVLYDGHKPGSELMTLKRAKIRGVESYSMVCSEKELGISEEHDGIILLPDDAPVGIPLADYMGDVVLTVKTNPNMARNTNLYGIAREIAALTGKTLGPIDYEYPTSGPDVSEHVTVEITNPDLNPRFVAGLIRGVTIQPSPYHVQRRLRLAGIRAISNIVDATNYVMLEVGQPLHAFDDGVLACRATANGGPRSAVRLITRTAHPGEAVTTLDGQTRKLDDFTILVTDPAGPLALGGVMGGAESEVSDATTDVLLEGAAWEFINIRKTLQAQKLSSEAGYRFSRGIHPAMTVRGVRRGLKLMYEWGGGTISPGLVDVYAKPAATVTVTITPDEVKRLLGIAIPAEEIVRILRALEFDVAVTTADGGTPSAVCIAATAPDHRLDIGEGAIGRADLIEEIARVYGYERIPETTMADALPSQRRNLEVEREELARDALVQSGLQEAQTYTLTTPEREARLRDPEGAGEYVRLLNPITPERSAMRRLLLPSVLDVAAETLRLRERVALFEIGSTFRPRPDQPLPHQALRLALVLAGASAPVHWAGGAARLMDFFDLKGVLEAVIDKLHIGSVRFVPVAHPSYMPGRTAELRLGERVLGVCGQLYPDVATAFDLPPLEVYAAELDLEAVLAAMNDRYALVPVPEFPPVKEDLALVLEEQTPVEPVAALIIQTGGALLTRVDLFDVYRGDQLGAGRKSLAFSLTWQALDRTLSGNEIAKLREKIIKRAEKELGATLRK